MGNILVTGGCGFVGSSLALQFKANNPGNRVVCLDNLKRRGSELNLPRLKEHGIEFVHGDIRNREDLEELGNIDVILECSAEPSVLAGYQSSPAYVINTNLMGTINCLELARKKEARFIFLSTNRVYPIRWFNQLELQETETRFEILQGQHPQGISPAGVSEELSLQGARSMYGATKLASELIIQEYVDMYGLKAVINRCGILAGPWQFGKVDQGVIALWAARHHWKQKLMYIGYGGKGKQVRDVLHVNDLYRLLKIQLDDIDSHAGEVYNVGGGREFSVSLKELTGLCQEATGNIIEIEEISATRPADIPAYFTDCSKVSTVTGWKPLTPPEEIVKEICLWIHDNELNLKGIFQ